MDGARCHLNDTVVITALSAMEPRKAEVNCSNCVEVRCEIKNERDTAEDGEKEVCGATEESSARWSSRRLLQVSF